MLTIELTIEERNVLLALLDAGTKAVGAQLFREGAGALMQSAFNKLSSAEEPMLTDEAEVDAFPVFPSAVPGEPSKSLRDMVRSSKRKTNGAAAHAQSS